VIDLTESNPTRVGLAYPEEEILESLADRRSLTYEPHPFGLAAAREAVAREMNGAVDPDRIVLTASTSEAYAFLFKLLGDPGDVVCVPRPGYPLFEYLGGLDALEPRAYPLDPDDGWSIDVEQLVAESPPRTRAVILVNPNNPTGSFLKTDEWHRLQPVCRERGWAVISDEVFAGYAWGEDPRRVPCAAAGAEALTFSLGGLSKSVGLPQLKLGWIAVGGPEDDARAALQRLELIADAYLSVGTPVQWALERLLEVGATVRAQIRGRVAQNLERLAARADGTPIHLLPSEGGWYAIVQLPAVLSEEEWAVRLLAQDGVAVHPGYFYEFPKEAFLVLSLLPPPDAFGEAADRLAARVESEI